MKIIRNASVLKRMIIWISAMTVSLPTIAMAHPGHHLEGGALQSLGFGFLHPFTGMDHMLLALAIGWLAFSLGAHRAQAPVLAFLVTLVIGALCGRWISGSTGLEIAISLTLLAAGGILLRDRLRRLGLLSIVAAASGVIHGLAHGAEALPGASFATYTSGLFVSTVLLLGAGALLQHTFSRTSYLLAAVRSAGLVMIAAGIISLLGIL